MKIGKRNGVGCQPVDVVIHPEFRHQGMFLAIHSAMRSEADKEGTDIIYGFPNNPSGHLRVGGPRTHVVCKARVLFKFIDPKGLPISLFARARTSTKFPKIRQTIMSVASIFSRLFLKAIDVFVRASGHIKNHAKAENLVIRTISSFDHRIDDLWNRVSKFYEIVVVRDKRYLNWRYFKKPNAKYKVLIGEENEKILGYIVLLCRAEKNLKVGYIVDVLASSKNTVESLISKAIECFREDNVHLIRCVMLKNSTYHRILRSYGFLPSTSIWFVARAHPSLSDSFVRDYKNWYITIGDTDYV
jgi:hypothetical protein